MIVKGLSRALYVDLSSRTWRSETLEFAQVRTYIGGRGIGAKLLFDRVPAGADPLGEHNILVFAAGPLTGTRFPASGRHAVVTKSPLTGLYNRSLAGGAWGTALRRAGCDVLVVEGGSESPVFLRISDGQVSFEDASPIWGAEATPTQQWLQGVCGPRVQSATIGPAGEQLIPYASIMSGDRAAGRGGVGAVMGAKKLKAVCVIESGKIEVHDSQRLLGAVSPLLEKLKGIKPGFGESGTTRGILGQNALGILPSYNFRMNTFDKADMISGERLREEFRVKSGACFSCPLACSKYHKVDSGQFAGAHARLEYETVWALGALCGIDSPEAVIYASMRCDELGLDTISAGVTAAFLMECTKEGLLEGDGQIHFGNIKDIAAVPDMIVERRGAGELLALGVKKASERVGSPSEQWAIHVKGMELPGYDPRGCQAQGLGFITSNRGACHNMGFATQELFGIPTRVDPLSIEGKGAIEKWNQDLMGIIDSAVVCKFPYMFTCLVDSSPFTEALSAVVGEDVFFEDLMKSGERIYNLERMFNVREGCSRKDDCFPTRLTTEAASDGVPKGHVFHQEPMLDEYYKVRGWDSDGIPTPEKLKELGLST